MLLLNCRCWCWCLCCRLVFPFALVIRGGGDWWLVVTICVGVDVVVDDWLLTFGVLLLVVGYWLYVVGWWFGGCCRSLVSAVGGEVCIVCGF